MTDGHDWQQALLRHFESIFNKPNGTIKQAAFLDMNHRLSCRCKCTPWQPFIMEELLVLIGRWGTHKSTGGGDDIANEALLLLIQYPLWGATGPLRC